MNRTKCIGTRVTPAEYERIEAMAKQTGRTISQVLRMLVLQGVAAPEPDIRLQRTDRGRPAP